MRALLVAFALCAASLSAADVSGKWTGTAEYEENGEQMKPAVVLDLKQDGATVTGNVSSEGESFPIRDGKLDGNRFTFSVDHSSGAIKFALDVNGSEMKGEGTHETEGINIKLAVQREATGTTSTPASVSGKWTGIADWGSGSQSVTFELKQDGQTVTGVATSEQGGPTNVEHGRIESGKFTFDSNPEDGPVKVELTVAGDKMTGTAVKMLNGSERYDINLSLKREL